MAAANRVLRLHPPAKVAAANYAPSTGASIQLRNRVVIEVHTASFKSTRGYTIVAALLFEFDQIEGTEHCYVVMVAITEEFEDREPLPIGGFGRRSDLRFATHDPRQPTSDSWSSQRHGGRAAHAFKPLRGGERVGFGAAARTVRCLVNPLDYKLMER
jgi:hypothetical protein